MSRLSAREKAGEGIPVRPAFPGSWWAITRRTFEEFGRDHGGLMAAAVAFYLLLSLIPLVLVAVALIGYALGKNPEWHGRVLTFLWEFMPGTEAKSQLNDWLNGLIQGRGKAGLLGLAGLLSTATGGFATLETAINVTWGTPSRNMVMNKVFALGMVFVIGALFFLSFAMSAALEWVNRLPVLAWVSGSWPLQAAGHLVPMLITGLALTALYKLFPTVRVPWKPALTAGFVTAFFWEAFKQGYAWYAGSFGSQSSTYGAAVGGIVGLVLWILYSSTLILLGSELTWVLSGCPGKDTAQ